MLTEAQLQVLEKRKNDKEARGEIETEHLGYLGSQDVYYVGTFKGIGRVYTQTYIDTYTRVADAKLYTDKSAITSADMLDRSYTITIMKDRIQVNIAMVKLLSKHFLIVKNLLLRKITKYYILNIYLIVKIYLTI